MSETVKKFSKIIFMDKNSRMIDFLLIILLSMNGIHSLKDGELVEEGEFNYVVSVQKLNEHLCTGTIIDETHIVTTAHLLYGAFRGEISVVATTTATLSEPVQRIGVKKIYLHPRVTKLNISQSVGEDWDNDIAIIELKAGFQPSNDYRPVQRTIIELDRLTCPSCTMVAWEAARSHPVKIFNNVFYLKPEECIRDHIHVGRNQKCFFDISGDLLINSGNLGSPIVCDNSMVGFVVKKLVDEFQVGTPSTFLEITAYSEFIHDVISKGLVDARSGEFPYIASIWHDNSYICGGSVLDATHILTTANCVQGKDKAKLKVVAGFTEASETHAAQSELSVRDMEINNDIVVLVLAEPVPFELTLRPLDYLNTKDASPGLFCDLPLWKDHSDSSVVKSKKLRKARVKISSEKNCKKALESQGIPVTVGKFCAKNQYFIKVTDVGDTGHPLICGDKFVGILVKGSPQHGQMPEAVFLQIDSHKEFIRSTITDGKTRVTTPSDLINFDSN